MFVRTIRKIRGLIIKRKCKSNNVPKIVGKVILDNNNITIGKNVVIFNDVKFWGDGPIIIGDNVKIGERTMIYASKEGGVTIGDNTIIAANCYIIDMDHGILKDELIINQPPIVEEVKIGSDCWIAEDVTVLKGSVISDGSVVGAKSLVNSKFDPYSIIVGIPGKKIKERM